jgi:hypothetical protein
MQGNLYAGYVPVGIHEQQWHVQAVIEAALIIELRRNFTALEVLEYARGEIRRTQSRVLDFIRRFGYAVLVVVMLRGGTTSDGLVLFFPVCSHHVYCRWPSDSLGR